MDRLPVDRVTRFIQKATGNAHNISGMKMQKEYFHRTIQFPSHDELSNVIQW